MELLIKQFAEALAKEISMVVVADLKRALAEQAPQQTSPASTNKFHSEKETAALIGKSVDSLRHYRRQGLIHCSKTGKTPFYSDAHIADFRARFDTMPEKKRQQFEAAKLELVPTRRTA